MALFGPGGAADRLKARIARKRALTRFVIIVERLWVLALPLLALIGLFVTLGWFGYFRAVPDWLRLVTLAIFLIAGCGAVWLLTRFRLPSQATVERRLETDNAISHQAITVQNDRLEADSAFSRALWQEHQRRMAARIDALRVDLPRPDTPRRDPYALRAVVVLLLVIAFSYSYSNQAGRIGDAFLPHAVANAPDTRIDAWVTPPAYTGRAPIFLTGGGERAARIDVPQGSEIVVRVSGGAGGESVSFTAEGAEAARDLAPAGAKAAPEEDQAAAGADARSYVMKATESGKLAVSEARSGDHEWTFGVIADNPPEIAFGADPRRAVNGALEIAFIAKDDYGVASAQAEIRPLEAEDEEARPLFEAPEYRLGLSRRGARVSEERASHDLTDHPWAGSRVEITLVAEDAAGQVARSEPREIVLPERPFSNPLARAVIEQRRTLALDADAVPRVLLLNDALTTAPEETFENLTHYLLIKSVRARVTQAYDDDMLRDAVAHMWDVALGIENGDLSLAEQRLRDAQNALAEALENEDATDEEIQALMDELREAMQEYLQALAEEMQNSDQAMEIPESAMENLLSQQDLENMLDQIENLAQQGAREEALQMLSELQQMMNNLQAGRQQQQGDNPMREQMDELGELMREQQELMNETFQLDQALRELMERGLPPPMGQPQPGEPQPGQGNEDSQQGQNGQGGQEGQSGQDGMSREELEQALRGLRENQEALRQRLSEFQQALEGMGIEPGEGFGSAEDSMGDAARSLGEGRGEQATGEQGQALEALRRGAQDMMNQMMQAMGEGEGSGPGQPGARARRSETDPLGRPRSTEGPDFGDDVKVPDEIDIQRAREILEAIRDRLGDALSPEMEKRYLERLLDMN